MPHETKSDSWTGAVVASVIILLWVISLAFTLSIDLSLWALPAVLVRTFLQTGLFIVVHDAIHGSVFPKNRQLNYRIGSLAITLYGFLPYEKLCLNHWKHHRSPGQMDDPDFHDGVHSGIFGWYFKFMTQEYVDAELRRKLLLYMTIAFIVLHFGFQVSGFNLFLFWLLPLVLSSMQLFFFGTYLPHRASNIDSPVSHNAVSSNYPVILSFLSCYHFGYHWEHHEYPDVAWYNLPQARQARRNQMKNAIGNLASDLLI